MSNESTLPAARRPRLALLLLPLLLPLLLLLAPPALAAQTIRIDGPAQLRENSRAFYTVVFSGLPEIYPGESIRPRLAHPHFGRVRARWVEPYEIEWDFGDGTPLVYTGERPTVAHVYEQQGSYTLRVEARNRQGVFAAATRLISVENAPPHIGAIETVRLDDTPRTLELSARVTDSPADEVSYAWDLGDGTLREGPDLWRIRHSWPEEGRYLVRLTARDADGGEATTTHEVEVRGARSASASSPAPPGPREALASTSFTARSSGAIAAVIDGRIEPLRGLYLRSVRPGVCRLVLTAWDPGVLASFTLVADLRGLRPEGATRFQLTAPQLYLAFDDGADRYAARRSTLVDAGVGTALRELESLMELAGGTPSEISERIGVDPTRAGGRPTETRTVRLASPFGLDEPASFDRIGGSFTLTLRPHDRVEAEFDLLLQNTDEDAPAALRILNLEGSFVLDLQGARGEGIVSYEDCFADGFSIASVTPERDAQHSSAYTAVRVTFDGPYDPATLDETTFELRYRDVQGNPVPVPGRIHRAEQSAAFYPVTPLLGGVRYEARVRTGEGGVRGRNGRALEDADGSGYHAWSFGTRLLFRGPSPHPNLSCHLFQTVRDAPLVRGKPAAARIYARWAAHPGVLADDQLQEFDARVVLKDERGNPLATARHDFVRPDLWAERGVSLADAEHTANVFRWLPSGDEGGQLLVDLEVATRPGRWEAVYSTRCPASYWGPQPRMSVDYYIMAIGAWRADLEPVRQTAHTVQALSEVFALQLFPLQSLTGRFRGVMTIPRELEREFPADSWHQALAVAAHYARMGRGDRFLSGVAGGTDFVVGFVPHTEEQRGGQVKEWVGFGGPGAAIMAVRAEPPLYDRYVHGLVHEIGHGLYLQHLPPAASVAEQEMAKQMRDHPDFHYDGIQGFRLTRDGRSGWNKSSTEGNAEGPRLAPLMFPATVPYRNTFIATHHYHQVQRKIEESGILQGAHAEERALLRLASASPEGWTAALAGTEVPRESTVAIAGLIPPRGEGVWMGPLVRTAGIAAVRTAAAGDGEFELALLDAAGERLHTTRFTSAAPEHGSGPAVFHAALPWSERAARLVLLRDGRVLAERRRSAHSPEVRFTVPSAGQRAEGSLDLAWTASDADGDELRATVLYSGDGVDDWSTLALWLEESSFTVDLDMLEPGANPTFRVVVTDGFDQAEADISVRIGSRLQVLAALPAQGAEASIYPDIIVTFNSDLTPESAAAARVRLYGNAGEEMQTELEYGALARMLIVSPATPLVPGTHYRAVLEGTLVDRFGNRLETPFRWEFRTAPASRPPASSVSGERQRGSSR